MKQTIKDSDMDDKLTEFTDRVLAGKSRQPDSNVDEEMRHLEETILRLKRALPRTEPNKAALKQLESRLSARLRQEQKSMTIPFWRKWFGQDRKQGHFRPQVAVAVALLVLAVLTVMNDIVFPPRVSVIMTAAFVNARVALIVITLVGLIFVLVWIGRRK